MGQSSEHGRVGLYLAVAGGVTMLVAAILSLFDGGGGHARAAATPASATAYVARSVRVRDAPTADGSVVLGELARGETLTGEWVTGADGATPWLRIRRHGQAAYVWGKNLSSQPRPSLRSTTGGRRTVRRTIPIDAEHGEGSTQLDVLSPGTEVMVIGTTTLGELEVAMPQGGVGYIPASAVL